MSPADILNGLNRGFVTGLLGSPVDFANALLGGIGGSEPFLGSKYIGDKLSSVGLLPSGGNKAAEFIGGLLGPGDAFKLAALPALRVAELTREFTPGDTTGHLPELLNDPALQQGYANLLEPILTGAQGQDRVAEALGARPAKTLPNVGYYEGHTAPGFASQIPVAMNGDKIAPSSKALMDAIAASHGLLATQKQSAYNVLAGAPTDRFALQFATGKPMSVDQLTALENSMHSIDPDIVPMVDPQGARALVFSGTPDERLAQFADVAKQHGAKLTAHGFDGDLFPTVDEYGTAPEKFSMQPYIDKIEQSGYGPAFNKNVAPLAQPMLDAVTQYATAHKLTQASWYPIAMKAIATGGLAKLKTLVKQGIVPAAVLAIGLSAVPPPSQSQSPQG